MLNLSLWIMTQPSVGWKILFVETILTTPDDASCTYSKSRLYKIRWNRAETKNVRLCPESKIVDVTFPADYMKKIMPRNYKPMEYLICDQIDKTKVEKTKVIVILKIWKSGLDCV